MLTGSKYDSPARHHLDLVQSSCCVVRCLFLLVLVSALALASVSSASAAPTALAQPQSTSTRLSRRFRLGGPNQDPPSRPGINTGDIKTGLGLTYGGTYGGGGGGVEKQKPEFVRLALAGSDALQQPSGMSVSWSTVGDTSTSVVLFGESSENLTSRVEGNKVKYLYTWHHHVVLENLKPSTTYFYRCGDDTHGSTQGENKAMSDVLFFKSAPDVRQKKTQEHSDSDKSNNNNNNNNNNTLDVSGTGSDETAGGDGGGFTVAVWGDMGQGDCSTDSRAMLKIFFDKYDFVWHLGDIAYQDDYLFLDFQYENILDKYMDEMSFTSAQKPYMVLPGNHEVDCHAICCILWKPYRDALRNFTAYNARYRMPSEESGGVMNMWYSYNYGQAHFISMNAETDYDKAYEGEHDEFYLLDSGHFNPTPNAYLEWLEKDLQQAADQRHIRPWIIAAGHRPLYLYDNSSYFRDAVEDLLVKYGVDLYLAGHVHSYYRTYPVYKGNYTKDYAQRKGKLVNIVAGGPGAIDRPMNAKNTIKTTMNTWFNSLYTTVVPWLTGSPHFSKTSHVNQEGLDRPDLEIVAHHTDDKSIGMLHVINETCIEWELISSDDGAVIDRLQLTK